MRDKYSFIVCHCIYGHSTLEESKSCKTLGKPRVLHDFETPWVDWLYIQWQPIKVITATCNNPIICTCLFTTLPDQVCIIDYVV